ncbi:MAG: hypothetical protein F6K04_00955 [Leptolyngbya sp. SIO4C5]|nr:hypothetical protein [Leptolyngbya sp. SIO4C5]
MPSKNDDKGQQIALTSVSSTPKTKSITISKSAPYGAEDGQLIQYLQDLGRNEYDLVWQVVREYFLPFALPVDDPASRDIAIQYANALEGRVRAIRERFGLQPLPTNPTTAEVEPSHNSAAESDREVKSSSSIS